MNTKYNPLIHIDDTLTTISSATSERLTSIWDQTTSATNTVSTVTFANMTTNSKPDTSVEQTTASFTHASKCFYFKNVRYPQTIGPLEKKTIVVTSYHKMMICNKFYCDHCDQRFVAKKA